VQFHLPRCCWNKFGKIYNLRVEYNYTGAICVTVHTRSNFMISINVNNEESFVGMDWSDRSGGQRHLSPPLLEGNWMRRRSRNLTKFRKLKSQSFAMDFTKCLIKLGRRGHVTATSVGWSLKLSCQQSYATSRIILPSGELDKELFEPVYNF